ncbi:hypothetical protein KO481_42250 [Nocardia sp. NEAU-G5]|uniref:DUF8020 domain-containing protein n=1 Tax=Nocardia albiluteola TaxID=2842303 RepID=A0ABS6BCW5_9NOCA|nr:hypothetical protein [Nocardia albiluteola]MBU3068127.1 hypothetical protein [Nocardia albiluteola]
MKLQKFVLTTAFALTVTSAGTAAADPGPAAGRVAYTARTTESSAIITTDTGSLAVDNGVFEVKAPNGVTLAGTKLSFRVDDFTFPIDARIDGHTAVLTPRLEPSRAVYQPAALPFEDSANWKSPYDRETAAWNRLVSTISVGAVAGTLLGTIGGAAAGCALGAIAGATVAAATIVGLFGPVLPIAVAGCLGGIAALGAVGTVAGELLVTAPIAIAGAVQYFTTINQPFTRPNR